MLGIQLNQFWLQIFQNRIFDNFLCLLVWVFLYVHACFTCGMHPASVFFPG